MGEAEIGRITHFFANIGVGVIEVTKGTLKVGDTIHIKGANTDFKQKIVSMQVEHDQVQEANEGQSIGMKLDDRVRQHDKVFKILSD